MIYGLFLIGLFIFDRITKWWAVHALATNEYNVSSYLSFELAYNRGISWGLLNGSNAMFWIVTAGIGIILTLLVGFCYVQKMNQQSIKAELLIITGATSNLIDRFFYPGVIDFIHVSYHGWSWPIFNVADICVVIGILWMAAKWMRA